MFLKHRTVHLRSFSIRCDKKRSTENSEKMLLSRKFRYPEPMTHWTVPLRNDSVLPPSPLPLIQKQIPIPESLRSTEGATYQVIGYCETTNSIASHISLSPLRHENFRNPELSETRKGSSTKRFSTVRQNNLDRKTLSPHPSFFHKNFHHRKISETQHRTVPPNYFSAIWNKKRFTEKVDSLYPKHFSLPKISGTLKGSATKLFGQQDKFFWKKILIPPPSPPPPPLLYIKTFDTRNFVKQRSVPLRGFRYCDTEDFRLKTVT